MCVCFVELSANEHFLTACSALNMSAAAFCQEKKKDLSLIHCVLCEHVTNVHVVLVLLVVSRPNGKHRYANTLAQT